MHGRKTKALQNETPYSKQRISKRRFLRKQSLDSAAF